MDGLNTEVLLYVLDLSRLYCMVKRHLHHKIPSSIPEYSFISQSFLCTRIYNVCANYTRHCVCTGRGEVFLIQDQGLTGSPNPPPSSPPPTIPPPRPVESIWVNVPLYMLYEVRHIPSSLIRCQLVRGTIKGIESTC